MDIVFLVMATSNQGEKSIPLRVFQGREQAEKWQTEVIDYHLSPPDMPINDDAGAWKEFDAKLAEWRNAHPAGAEASRYNRFSMYEVPAA